jgi:hypothetical protein
VWGIARAGVRDWDRAVGGGTHGGGRGSGGVVGVDLDLRVFKE